MELWTVTLSSWKCHWPDLKSAGLFRPNLSWCPSKPQHSNPNPNSLANRLWCIDFLTPPTPLIITHRLPAFLESLMSLKHWCSIHARWSKSSLKHSIRFCGLFTSSKQNLIAYRSSSRPYCIFKIHEQWQTGFSRVYSNCCFSCSFESEIIKIGQLSYKMYSNNILNFQGSTPILNACTKKPGNLLKAPRMCFILIMRKDDNNTSSASWKGVLNQRSWGQLLSWAILETASWHWLTLIPTDSDSLAGICIYYFKTTTTSNHVIASAYIHTCILFREISDWLFGRESIWNT